MKENYDSTEINQNSGSKDVGFVNIKKRIKQLEHLCKKLYSHIDIEYCKKIEIPDNLKDLFTTIHRKNADSEFSDDEMVSYLDETKVNIDVKSDQISNKSNMRGSDIEGQKNGLIESLYPEDHKDGLVSSVEQFKDGRQHGMQVWRCKDGPTYNVFDEGVKVFVEKQVKNNPDRTIYFNLDDTSKDFYRLKYFIDDSKIEVKKKEGDKQILTFRQI